MVLRYAGGGGFLFIQQNNLIRNNLSNIVFLPGFIFIIAVVQFAFNIAQAAVNLIKTGVFKSADYSSIVG